MIGTGPDKRPQEQAVAACLNIWRESKKSARQDDGEIDCPDPDDDESHDDYIDRCIDEVTSNDDSLDENDAEEACQMHWEETRAASGMIQKTHAATVQGMEFVLSDETPDRLGDIIMAAGWDLSAFQKNPIALFGHRVQTSRSAAGRTCASTAPHCAVI